METRNFTQRMPERLFREFDAINTADGVTTTSRINQLVSDFVYSRNQLRHICPPRGREEEISLPLKPADFIDQWGQYHFSIDSMCAYHGTTREMYEFLLKRGVPKEEALQPTSLRSNARAIDMTLREFGSLNPMCSKYEMRCCTINEIGEYIYNHIKIRYDDIFERDELAEPGESIPIELYEDIINYCIGGLMEDELFFSLEETNDKGEELYCFKRHYEEEDPSYKEKPMGKEDFAILETSINHFMIYVLLEELKNSVRRNG